MSNRLKEDDKNEKIIRGLLKLPENRRCINCNSLGPQYVCTNFWTFVCTNCSGIHREFTHRIKSISMAKFTSQEVNALQEGGNQHAKDICFKEWDPQRNSLPDSSNIDRLRTFIKHVYVDRRYTGERSDRPPRGKTGDKEEFYEKGSRSPPQHEDAYGRHSGRSFDERRSPGYEQEARKFGDYRRSPSEPQIINDWRHEDRFGNEKKFEDRRSSDADYKSEGQSPEQPKDLESSSPPVIRPVRDILGDNVVPLRINAPPKANGGRTADGSTHTPITTSSSGSAPTSGKPEEVKLENKGTLIDFDAKPEPPVSGTVPKTQPSSVAPSVTQPNNASNNNNWASFDFAPQSEAPRPSNANTLDSLFSQLSSPTPMSGHNLVRQGGPNILAAPSGSSMTSVPAPGASAFQTVGLVPMSSFTSNVSPVASTSGFSMVLPTNTTVVAPGLMATAPSGVQHQQPGNQSLAQYIVPTNARASDNQTWNVASAPVMQGSLGGLVPQSSQVVSKPVPETTSGVASQSFAPEVQSSGRKELPEDLFTTSFTRFPTSVPGWNMAPPHGMVFPMQYNMPAPNVLQLSKSANPFDSSGEMHFVQAPIFPSMSSLQGALPNLLPPSASLMHTPSMVTPSPAWMPAQSAPYGSALPLQVPSHASAMAPGAYVGQVPINMSRTGYQGAGGFGIEGAAFGPSNPDQLYAGRLPAPAAPTPFSSAGGNPFG